MIRSSQRRAVAIVAASCWMVYATAVAAAQPNSSPPTGSQIPTAAPSVPSSSEFPNYNEVLVPPQGATIEIPLRIHVARILEFPEPLAPWTANCCRNFDTVPWDSNSLGVMAKSGASDANLTLATVSGAIKVNLKFRVVSDDKRAPTLVRFRLATPGDAFAAHVAAETQRQLTEKARALTLGFQQRAEEIFTDRVLQRFKAVRLEAHARNDDHVILHVRHGAIVGNTGYITFDIENRSRRDYRLATVRVFRDGSDVGSNPRMESRFARRAPQLIGLVPRRSTARAVVTIPEVNAVLDRPLRLELAEPDGEGVISTDQMLVFK